MMFWTVLLALAAPPTAADEKHFAAKVLPILTARCLACHGEEAKRKGGFDLRTRTAALAGGDSGTPAVVPGKPDESPLVLSVTRTHADWSAMPPKESDKLSADEVKAVRGWVAAGAPWPTAERLAELAKEADGVTVATSGGLSAEWTNRRYKPADLWAFRPVADPTPAKTIDDFLNARLAELKLSPAAPADPRTLLRRVTFDMTGLPPTPAETDAFLADPSPDAYAKLIDLLLASPHYGERMAQHWLDVTRYADSAGFANDYERGPAWRYRDYVVRSFNADKPYDRFVREQIAGDEIDETDPEHLVAVGFLRMGPWELTGMEVPKVARQRFLDDVTDSVGQTFLAQPLQCCRCHDHKFDPIPTRDYYGVQAVFATTQLTDRPAAFLDTENRAGFDEKTYFEQRRERFESELKRLRTAEAAAKAKWEADHPPTAGRKPERHEYLTPADLGLERIARKGLERLKWQLDRYEPVALSVYSGRSPDVKAVYAPPRLPADRTKGMQEVTAVLTGGDPFSPASEVVPAVLSAADGGTSGAVPAGVSGRRKAFAEWVASPANPLTARVMANRVWAWHFGTPLAGNPNNFGATGQKPTHPELLDWLAARLVADGWSVKALHRRILLSAAYRRSARHPDPTAYAAFKPRRLSAEEIRDATLSATGELNRQVGGVPCRPEMNPEVAYQPRQVMGTFAEVWQPNPTPGERHRRSLYVLRLRGLRDPFFEAFNQPTPESACERRDASTVAPQAFTLFNSAGSYDRALALADAVKDDPDPVRQLFRRTVGRPPTDAERAGCVRHWTAMTARHEKLTFAKRPVPTVLDREAVEENTGEKFRFREPLEAAVGFVPDRQPADCPPRVRGLAEVCLVLLNSNEFVYVD